MMVQPNSMNYGGPGNNMMMDASQLNNMQMLLQQQQAADGQNQGQMAFYPQQNMMQSQFMSMGNSYNLGVQNIGQGQSAGDP